MAGTYRADIVREVALATNDFADLASLHERAKFFDIISCRPPKGGTAKMCRAQVLWILIEGPDDTMWRLKDPLSLPRRDDGDFQRDDIAYDKRRYCIPLSRLEAFGFSFDEARARDQADDYQPFMGGVDEDTGLWFTPRRPLRFEGLIFDKITGKYLA